MGLILKLKCRWNLRQIDKDVDAMVEWCVKFSTKWLLFLKKLLKKSIFSWMTKESKNICHNHLFAYCIYSVENSTRLVFIWLKFPGAAQPIKSAQDKRAGRIRKGWSCKIFHIILLKPMFSARSCCIYLNYSEGQSQRGRNSNTHKSSRTCLVLIHMVFVYVKVFFPHCSWL